MTKGQKIAYYILSVVVSGLFIFSGYAKLTANAQAIQSFAVAGLPIWFMYAVGTGEILGAIGIWIGRVRFWAAIGLFEILAGAIVLSAIFVSAIVAIFPLCVAIALAIALWLKSKDAASNI